jgi:hypothetical protein
MEKIMDDHAANTMFDAADYDDGSEGMDELTMLKQRADSMGIKYAHKIGVEALRKKINDRLEDSGDNEPADEDDEETASVVEADPVKKMTKAEAEHEFRKNIVAEQMKLVRLRITNLNPNKRLLMGEIFTVANEYIGNVRKFVPYGEVTDEGYHVPYCIYTQLKDRKFLDIKTRRDRTNGQVIVEERWVPEFALDVLPQLTAEELRDLAIAQATAGGV